MSVRILELDLNNYKWDATVVGRALLRKVHYDQGRYYVTVSTDDDIRKVTQFQVRWNKSFTIPAGDAIVLGQARDKLFYVRGMRIRNLHVTELLERYFAGDLL